MRRLILRGLVFINKNQTYTRQMAFDFAKQNQKAKAEYIDNECQMTILKQLPEHDKNEIKL
jgi:hypothetical protein